MAADASIYGLIQPQKAVDPLEQASRAMTLQGLMGQQELQGLQTQQVRQGMADEQAVKAFYGNMKPGEDPRAKIGELMRINPKAGREAQKFYQDQDKNDSELQKHDRENFVALVGQRLKERQTVQTPEQYAAHRDSAIQQAGMFKTHEFRKLALQSAMSMPESYDAKWVARSIVEGKELFTPRLELVTRPDGSQEMVDKNTFTNPNAGQFASKPGMTPTQKATTDTAAGQLKVSQGQLAETKVNNQRPVYDIERGGFAPRPQPGVTSTFLPVAGAPMGQKEKISLREDTDNLRKEFEAKPNVKAYRDVIPISSAASSAPDTRSGDIQMAYAVGKILDPSSVVREGELKLVGDAATVMGKIEGQLRTLTQGKGRLTPETRAELNAMLKNAVDQRKASFDAEKQSYGGIVERRGYKPEDVFIDTPLPAKATSPAPVPDKSVPGAVPQFTPEQIRAELIRRKVIK